MSRKLTRSRAGRRHRRNATADAEASRQLSLVLDWTPPKPAASARLLPLPSPHSVTASKAAVSEAGAPDSSDRPLPPDAILRLPAVKAATGLCRSVIYERIRKGTFPQSVPLGPKSVGWPSSVIAKWVQQTIATPQKARAPHA